MLKAAMAVVSMDDTVPDVLPRCPYHDEIVMFNSAKDTFNSQEGLLDFQEFSLRHDIISKQKAVATFELIYHDDVKMVLSGLSRMTHVVKDSYYLYKNVFKSDNWSVAANSISAEKPAKLAMKGYLTWNQVKSLRAEGKYEEAGAALITGLFSEQLESHGNVEWNSLPYEPAQAGEEVAGAYAGLIFAIDMTENYDDL